MTSRIFGLVIVFAPAFLHSSLILSAENHETALVRCDASLTEVVPTMAQKFSALITVPEKEKRARLQILRTSFEKIAQLAKTRPTRTDLIPGLIEITHFTRGLSHDDFASTEDRKYIIEMLASIGISENMWVAKEGEIWPIPGVVGLAREILDYEYCLSAMLTGLINKTPNSPQMVASIFDKLLRRHESFLSLSEKMKAALDEGFTLIGFGPDGLIPPRGTTLESLRGREILVEISDSAKEKSISEQYQEHLNESMRYERAIRATESNTLASIDSSELPSILKGHTLDIANLKRLKGHKDKIVIEAPKASGIYRGTIENFYPAGFEIRTGETKTTFNTNWLIWTTRAIAVKF